MGTFSIDQAGGSGAGTTGESRHDLQATFAIQLTTTVPAGATAVWEILDKVGSTATLTGNEIGPGSAIVAPCSFLVQLTVTLDTGAVEREIRIASVRSANHSLRVPVFGEKAPSTHTLATNLPFASTDNATYANLAGLGSSAQNWRGWAQWALEVVVAMEAISGGAAASQTIRQATNASVSGDVWENVGSLYLSAGTLKAGSRVFAGDALAVNAAEVELRRETGSTLIASWSVSGALAEDALAADTAVPADGWYNIRLRGDVPASEAVLKGISLEVV